jgi:hypothetical protein
MPVDRNNYGSRGGNLAIVLCCPNIVADDRLVYFDYNKKSEHWVIRDFISGQRLDNDHSKLTFGDIEADASHNESPVWCNVEVQPREWQIYLSLRATAVFRLNGPLSTTRRPNPQSGDWQPIRF